MPIVLLDERDKEELQEQIDRKVGKDEFEELSDPNRHAEYFTITDDGVVSLKPEYRGSIPSSKYPYSISDNGQGVAGSKNGELPQDIVVPEVVNEIAVVTLPIAMFAYNTAIKSITIPKFITEIPQTFAREAVNLHTISGTENVKTIGKQAFYATRIKKANFPNLEDLSGTSSQFKYCAHLVFADIGNKITEIPEGMFYICDRLSCVHGGEKVTSVGVESFVRTRRLKNLNFLPKLTNIGNRGFCASRVDYDWSSLTNCSFGTNATNLQYNPTDFWSACTSSACNTPLHSVFVQNNPKWASDTIGNTQFAYGASGCNPVSAAMVYSAFENKTLSSPKDFEEIVKAINPSLMDLDVRHSNNITQWLEAVGYTVVSSSYNSANLQTLYNALSTGALVITASDANIASTFGEGHSVVIHGINENGEVLVQDPKSNGEFLNDYTCVPFAIHIKNLVKMGAGFLIVTKD